MLARFFIDRPILAWVISIVIVLMGSISYKFLPVAQYPQITPPVVRVSAIYPGASAEVVAQTVAAPIEQQVNGVEGMLYMSSQSSNDGSYNLDVTFELGTDVNVAQVLVQNRVAIAQPQLPDVLKATGVTVKKRSPDILLVVNLYSDNDPATGRPYYDRLYLSNFATIQLLDPIARLEGVGDVFSFGGQNYSMRIWLDPDKLAAQLIGRQRRPGTPGAKRTGRRRADRAAAGAGRSGVSVHRQRSRSTGGGGTVRQHHFEHRH